MPFFSIIVPCYNQAQYLPETIDSVLSQTYTNWECLIINDGSSDNTEEVALQLIKEDSRIKYLKKDNGGLANTRNYGIERSLGSWILPLDSDDKIGEYYLEYAYNEIQKNKNLTLVYSRVSFFGNSIGEWILPKFDYTQLLIQNHIFCSGIFKKSDWSKVGGYDVNMVYGLEDWEFWISILKDENVEVSQLDYIGFYYRQKDLSMTKDLHANKMRLLSMYDYIFEKHKQVYINNFGPVQDILLDRELLEQKKNNIRVYARNVKHNWVTKSLYRIILLLNKF